ncbi:MAG TPA: Ku protein [Candidatus Binatia bacterium]|nr:Ku protein [Candidatus Binatia bacterium]
MRPIWTGAITVGLVNIPISLVTAYSHRGVEFRLLHKKCKTRITYGRHCAECKEEVAWEDVVRAYEYRKGQFVVVDEKDLKLVDPKLAKTVDVREFVDADKLDPIFVNHVYYLVPGKNAAKAYFLFMDILADAKKVALAKMIMRDKEQWVAVRAAKGALQLIDLHYEEEIVPMSALELPKRPAMAKNDLRLAERVVESFAAPFKPQQYKDEFEEKLKKYVAKKVKGKKVVFREPPRSRLKDLTSALEASIRKAKR